MFNVRGVLFVHVDVFAAFFHGLFGGDHTGFDAGEFLDRVKEFGAHFWSDGAIIRLSVSVGENRIRAGAEGIEFVDGGGHGDEADDTEHGLRCLFHTVFVLMFVCWGGSSARLPSRGVSLQQMLRSYKVSIP